MNLNGKVVVVTGAGSGMGRELTLQLLDKGAKVVAIDLNNQSLQETVTLSKDNFGQVKTIVLDITDSNSVSKLPQLISQSFGEPDVLINNAGIIQPFVRINDLTLDQAEKVMDINFRAPLTLIKALLPGLLTRPEAHILNVSSMGAYAPVPGQSVYGASKAALKLLTEGLRSELINTHVGVTIVFPGAIATNIAANSAVSIAAGDSTKSSIKMTSAPKAAALMIKAIENGEPRLVIGKDAKVLDYISRLNPVFAAKMIYKQMADLLK